MHTFRFLSRVACPLFFTCALALVIPVGVQAASLDELTEQMQKMQEQMLDMQKELDAAREESAAAKAEAEEARRQANQAVADGVTTDSLRRALKQAEMEEERNAIAAGTVAEAKPRSERTEEDNFAMGKKQILEDGILPGYRVLGGSNTQYKIGGFVRVDLGHDFDRVQDNFDEDIGNWAFATLTDNDPGKGEAGKTYITTQATRINMDLRTPTPGYGGNFKEMNIFVEGDFYETEDNFRIRHAYGEWGSLLVGKTWPMFMPVEAMPAIFDFAGPVISNPVRENEIRWDQPFGEHFKLGINATEPGAQITIPDNVGGDAIGQTSDSLPDVTVRAIYQKDWGHLKASGMFRDLRVDSREVGVSDDSAVGWNAFLSGGFNLPNKDKIGWGASYGKGFSKWRTGLNGQDMDAVYTATGDLQRVDSYGAFATYEHHWKPNMSSSFIYSYLGTDTPDASPVDFIDRENYGLANVIWSVTPVLDIGTEYVYADRTNIDGTSGNRNRLSLVFIWKFHPDQAETSAYRNLSYLIGGG